MASLRSRKNIQRQAEGIDYGLLDSGCAYSVSGGSEMTNLIVEKSTFRTMRLSPKLRFVERDIPDPADSLLCLRVRILQQAYACIEDGSIEWVDVPLESEAL